MSAENKQEVPEIDYYVLSFLAAQPQDWFQVEAIASEVGLDQAKVAAVGVSREQRGHIEIQELPYVELRAGKKIEDYTDGFPERKVVEALHQLQGEAEIPQVAEAMGAAVSLVGQSLKGLESLGWATKEGKLLKVTPQAPELGDKTLLPEEQLVQEVLALGEEGFLTAQASRLSPEEWEQALKALKGKKGVVQVKDRVIRSLKLTDSGRSLVDEGIRFIPEVNLLTSEMLKDGSWKTVRFRPYDVTCEAEKVFPAKIHPLTKVFDRTRSVFLELGFEETRSGFVESGFWDFDALFQPQDHPARDMQDTFYVKSPERCDLPDDTLVEAVQQTHENGGDTGSVGWRYQWDRNLAHKPVLRTHMTAATVRALAAQPQGPRKVFCVGPVFRRETVDYKHLPVFHQVDGIIIDKDASFASLLGTLKAFYRKMGFEKFQFRPAFFPYTEPSVEIFVWLESKQDWVEMGGAGIFRPEVVEPLGCKDPVLAWGLGLERLAMIHYEMASIGELYRARLPWLKEVQLCR